jgi:hypothetical protein
MTELLKQQEYHELPETQRLIALCRQDIVAARIKLASARELTKDQRDTLWRLVESREWFVKMVGKDFKAELERVDRELEIELGGG